MNLITQFTVLLERSRIRRRSLGGLVMALFLSTSLFGAKVAYGQTAQSKIAKDLQSVIAASTTPSLS